MLISDWSSDVCSSDLADPARLAIRGQLRVAQARDDGIGAHAAVVGGELHRVIAAGGGGRQHRGLRVGIARLRRIATGRRGGGVDRRQRRSEEHTSELQSLMRTSYAVFCLKKKKKLSTTHA